MFEIVFFGANEKVVLVDELLGKSLDACSIRGIDDFMFFEPRMYPKIIDVLGFHTALHVAPDPSVSFKSRMAQNGYAACGMFDIHVITHVHQEKVDLSLLGYLSNNALKSIRVVFKIGGGSKREVAEMYDVSQNMIFDMDITQRDEELCRFAGVAENVSRRLSF